MDVPAGTRLFEGVAAPQRGLVGDGRSARYVGFDTNAGTDDFGGGTFATNGSQVEGPPPTR